MRFIDNKGITDPSLNLALEEFVLRNTPLDETFFLFYVNEPSIIIGRNQNTSEEIHQKYVEENGIHVVRRLSGGGAVYHDLGNLNFSFVTRDDGESFNNFKKFTEPVIEALRKLGVMAELSGRNDIEVEGRKISGNAQFTSNGKMFSHGTLLFDVHMENVALALNVKRDKIESKGVKSVRSRVANISEYLTEKVTMEQFRTYLLKEIFGGEEKISTYELSKEDWEKVEEIANTRYRNWDWNYGKSLSATISNNKRFPIGSIDVRLQVSAGMIEGIKIYGDFFSKKSVSDIEDLLKGTTYSYEAVSDRLKEIEITEYFGNITLEDFLSLLF